MNPRDYAKDITDACVSGYSVNITEITQYLGISVVKTTLPYGISAKATHSERRVFVSSLLPFIPQRVAIAHAIGSIVMYSAKEMENVYCFTAEGNSAYQQEGIFARYLLVPDDLLVSLSDLGGDCWLSDTFKVPLSMIKRRKMDR